MGYSRKTLKLVSEAISVLILMGIAVVAGYIIYRGLLFQMLTQQYGVQAASEIARSRIAERFDLVDGVIKMYNASYKELVLIIYNYGDKDIVVEKVFVPGITYGGKLKINIYDVNYKIKHGETDVVRIAINDTSVSYPPGIIIRVSMQTDIGRIYSLNVKTVR